MIRKSKDPEHFDAHTDADWSGDSINRESTSVDNIGAATLREFSKGQSRQTLSSGGERLLRYGDNNDRGIMISQEVD